MVRPASDRAALPWAGAVELFTADLRGGEDLAGALDGIEAVVHLAARVDGDDADQFAAAVRGTERLLEAMARAGTRRLVLASSMAVYDWSAASGTLTEQSPLEDEIYQRDGYAQAKWWQERLARRLCAQHGIALTVLRPGFIWGPGNVEIAGVGQRVGRWHVVVGPRRTVPLTYVENCADCFGLALEDPAAVGGTFNVVDPDAPTAWEFASGPMRRAGSSELRLPLPYAVASRLVRLVWALSRLVLGPKLRLPGLLTPRVFDVRFKPLRYSSAALQQALGWKPPLSFDRSVATCSDVTVLRRSSRSDAA
jgi:UDP-glucose 4-epimerase